MAQKLLADWTTDDFHTVEHGVLLAQHRLAETGLFSDESLAHIIDTHPDESLTVGRMGSNSHKFDWRHGDRNGVSVDPISQRRPTLAELPSHAGSPSGLRRLG